MTNTETTWTVGQVDARPDVGAQIERLTREGAGAREVPDTGRYTLVTDPGRTVHIINPDALDPIGPTRKTGNASFTEINGFCAYTERHAGPGATLWADLQSLSITAVLNDDAELDADYRDHRAHLNLASSPEADAILQLDTQIFSQQGFAEWLEQWSHLIASPDAATTMEIVLTMEQTVKVDWRSSVRLSDGQRQLQYQETRATKAGQNGTVTVPDEITFAAPVFRNTATLSPIVGKLRYRVTDAAELKISVVLVAAQAWVEAAFDQVVTNVEMRTSREVWHGTPPVPVPVDDVIYTIDPT